MRQRTNDRRSTFTVGKVETLYSALQRRSIVEGIDGQLGEEEIWADDWAQLMRHLNAVPAFFGGGSSGARLALLTSLRHADLVRGLLLLRITGGAFTAGRLPDNYYGQFIRAAEQGGMAAVCATPVNGSTEASARQALIRVFFICLPVIKIMR